MRAAGLEVVADILESEVQFTSLMYKFTRICKEKHWSMTIRQGLFFPYKSFWFQTAITNTPF